MRWAALLEEERLVDPVRIALQRQRAAGQVRQQARRDAHVVVDHLALREASRVEDLVEVRQRQLVALDLDPGAGGALPARSSSPARVLRTSLARSGPERKAGRLSEGSRRCPRVPRRGSRRRSAVPELARELRLGALGLDLLLRLGGGLAPCASSPRRGSPPAPPSGRRTWPGPARPARPRSRGPRPSARSSPAPPRGTCRGTSPARRRPTATRSAGAPSPPPSRPPRRRRPAGPRAFARHDLVGEPHRRHRQRLAERPDRGQVLLRAQHDAADRDLVLARHRRQQQGVRPWRRSCRGRGSTSSRRTADRSRRGRRTPRSRSAATPSARSRRAPPA